MTEWEVWLSDVTTRNSRDHKWGDDWDGVLVLRYWGKQDGVNWGDSLYGHPATLKNGIIVSDEKFKQAFDAAQSQTIAPSKR